MVMCILKVDNAFILVFYLLIVVIVVVALACRWPYKIIDEQTGQEQETTTDGDYRLALKYMCMYRNIPDLIQAGVYSFKIEGRMRSADFVANI